MDNITALLNDIPSPCYVVEEELLRRNLRLIQKVAEESGAEIILAFKAFALWKTFPVFREYISHTTASSIFEARLAFEEFGSRAHTYSPAYTEHEFDQILACSKCVTFNSLSQYQRFFPLVEDYNQNHEEKVQMGLRVNPEYSEIETLLYNPCAPGSRFGVMAADLPTTLPDGIKGFHVHCHCENDSYALERTLVHIEEKFSRWFDQIEWLNLGGGHLMTRKDYDVNHLIGVLKGLRKRYPWLKVILEPGSAFAWQTGPLVASVVDVVENSGVKTVILDVSFTCHMPDCLEMPYHSQVRGAVTISSDVLDDARKGGHIYRLGGNSCLSGDFMGLWQFDHPLQVGERIIFEDMIHYTTVKTNMFNGIPHPAIGMVTTDGKFKLLRSFTYEDYRDRMD